MGKLPEAPQWTANELAGQRVAWLIHPAPCVGFGPPGRPRGWAKRTQLGGEGTAELTSRTLHAIRRHFLFGEVNYCTGGRHKKHGDKKTAECQ
ncbi:hypothetical protein niasHT_011353 [Heterodera trifolii]|uniref:Uncharacterized protein n=1 Tax=Heterodera trifolii TaxID=157864 RepID=A0ABD2LI69_9BILA